MIDYIPIIHIAAAVFSFVELALGAYCKFHTLN